jgi:hypothetical protein
MLPWVGEGLALLPWVGASWGWEGGLKWGVSHAAMGRRGLRPAAMGRPELGTKVGGGCKLLHMRFAVQHVQAGRRQENIVTTIRRCAF